MRAFDSSWRPNSPPVIGDHDRRGYYDPATFSKMASMGLTGICIPERYGGLGMDYVTLGLLCEELEYVDTSLRTILSVHTGLCSLGLYQWGTEEQKQKYLVHWPGVSVLASSGSPNRTPAPMWPE